MYKNRKERLYDIINIMLYRKRWKIFDVAQNKKEKWVALQLSSNMMEINQSHII